MSFVSGTTGTEAAQKFLEVLQNDFRTLSNETKKKYPQIKEVSHPIPCSDCSFTNLYFIFFQCCDRSHVKRQL